MRPETHRRTGPEEANPGKRGKHPPESPQETGKTTPPGSALRPKSKETPPGTGSGSGYSVVVKYLVHERIQLAPLLLGGAARTAVAEDEDRLARHVELRQLLLRRDVEAVIRNVSGPLAARHQPEHLVRIGHLPFAHGDQVADLHFARGLGEGAVHRHLVGADGVRRIAAGLENPHGPKVFVQTNVVHNRKLCDLNFRCLPGCRRPRTRYRS